MLALTLMDEACTTLVLALVLMLLALLLMDEVLIDKLVDI